MDKNVPIFANVELRSNCSAIPKGGLLIRNLRVELCHHAKPDEAWLAELIVSGDLPWSGGEVRDVEVRIMSENFQRVVPNESPKLLVRYGSEIVGDLSFH